jgi:hypothetical protein
MLRRTIIEIILPFGIAATIIGGWIMAPAWPKDDGRFANSTLKTWFDSLASEKGLCCSFADGVSIEDVDWDNSGPNNGYRVRLNGQWMNVPPEAVIKQPNKFGAAVVWPYQDANGVTQIRCFIPGASS